MSVGQCLLGLKHIRGFVSILRYINPTIIIITIINIGIYHEKTVQTQNFSTGGIVKARSSEKF